MTGVADLVPEYEVIHSTSYNRLYRRKACGTRCAIMGKYNRDYIRHATARWKGYPESHRYTQRH